MRALRFHAPRTRIDRRMLCRVEAGEDDVVTSTAGFVTCPDCRWILDVHNRLDHFITARQFGKAVVTVLSERGKSVLFVTPTGASEIAKVSAHFGFLVVGRIPDVEAA